MDIRQLRYFLGVVRAGSFSRAAEILGVVQPALGAQIRRLEAELGLPLLRRLPRGVVVTPAGERMVAHAERVLADMATIRAEMAELAGRQARRVVLALSRSSDQVLAGQLAELCRHRLPELELSLVEAATAQMRDWLVAGRIDAALTFGDIAGPGLAVQSLAEEELCLVVAGGGRARKAVTLAEAVAGRLVLPKPRRHVRELVEQAARQDGLALLVGYEVDSFRAAREFARRGLGSAILPRSAVATAADRAGLSVRRIGPPPLVRRLRLATRAEAPAEPLAAMLAALRVLAGKLPDVPAP